MDKYCHGTILVQQQSRHQQPLYLLLSDVWASLSLITLRAPTLTGIDKNQLQWNNVNLGGKKITHKTTNAAAIPNACFKLKHSLKKINNWVR